MRGRKPIPNALHDLHGNPGKRRRNLEPKLPPGLPSCPDHLDKQAKTEWRRLVKDLHAAGLLKRIDRAMLAAACQSYSRWARLERIVQSTGEVIQTGSVLTDSDGNVLEDTRQFKPNPYLGALNRALKQMHCFYSEFGMSAASRARLHLEGQASSSEHDELKLFVGS